MTNTDIGPYTIIGECSELNDLIESLQAATPLVRLTNAEAHVVFGVLLQRGFKITRPAAANGEVA